MFKKILLSVCIILVTYNHSISQKINIGQAIPPDIELHNIFNYPSRQINLSDFKGKLIIFDFWSHNCTTCIQAFSKIDSLQKEYGNKIQFIAVGKETEESTRKLFAKLKKIKIPDIPFVTSDKYLNQLFPHVGVPFHVWVDGNGIVRYKTKGHNATSEHIARFLQGQNLQINQREILQDFDNRKPAIAQNNEKYLEAVDYYSYVMHGIPNIELFGTDMIKNGGEKTRMFWQSSILDLLITAFSEDGRKYNFKAPNTSILNTVSLNVINTEKYIQPENPNIIDSWRNENLYLYDLLLPASKAHNRYKFMQQDIVRFFDLDVKIEKRTVKCWVLIRTSDIDKLKTRQSGSVSINSLKVFSFKSKAPYDSVRTLVNRPFEDLTHRLSAWIRNNLKTPFVDSTGYKGNIDFCLNGETIDSFNILALKKELQNYDLDLIEKDCLTDVLVIRENRK